MKYFAFSGLVLFYFGWLEVTSGAVAIESLASIDMQNINPIVHSINTGMFFIELSVLILVCLIIYDYLKDKR